MGPPTPTVRSSATWRDKMTSALETVAASTSFDRRGRSIRRSLKVPRPISRLPRTRLNYLGAVQLILKFAFARENATSGIPSTSQSAQTARVPASPARPRWTACVMRGKPAPCTTTDSPPHMVLVRTWA